MRVGDGRDGTLASRGRISGQEGQVLPAGRVANSKSGSRFISETQCDSLNHSYTPLTRCAYAFRFIQGKLVTS